MKTNQKLFAMLFALCLSVVSTSVMAQTVIFQSGFETGEPAFTYAAGTVNTPVLGVTGGSIAPQCGTFATNGKYNGAFITGATVSLQAGKYYQLNLSHRVVTCVGSLKVYRSTAGASFANATAGTLLATITTNQTAFTNATVLFTVPTNVNEYLSFVSAMTASGCGSSNFWLDDISITEYDSPPCGFYCNTGNASAITSYISNVTFNTINRSSAWNGYICTGNSTTVRKTLSYQLNVSAYNFTTSQKVVAAWIDWNKDGVYSDPSERIMGTTDITSATVPVTSNQSVNVTIPSTASLGTTKMRVAMVIGTLAQTIPCNTAQLSDYEDYDIVIEPAPVNMVYTSTSTNQVTGNVHAGSLRQEVLQVKVNTTGQLNAPSATQMVFTTLGTTDVSNISNARLYYTGSSSIYNSNTQLGATIASPPSDPSTMTFAFNKVLLEGDNYFWISYDVFGTAPTGNVIDAKLSSLTVAGTTYNINSTPAGDRPITGSTNMVLSSVTTIQNSNPVAIASALNDVIRIEVTTAGAINPISLSSLTFRTNGTTNIGDIQNARVFYTADFPVFSASTQVGSTLNSPPGYNSDFTVSASSPIALVMGKNYFWLTYDVNPSAACNPAQIDAQCTSVGLSTGSVTPSPTSPVGARAINCGTAYYSQCSCDMMNPANWNTMRNGTGTSPANVSALAVSTNGFYVQSGHSMTTAISDTISNLYLEPGSYVTASQFIVLGTLYIQSFATYEQTYSQTNNTIGGGYISSFYIKKDGTWKHNNVGWLPGTAGNQCFEPYSIQWFQGVGAGTFPGSTNWGTVILDVPTVGNLCFNGASLSSIHGDLDIRRWGGATNYFFINMDNPLNVDGNLILRGGVMKGVGGLSCNAAGSCSCNQAANAVPINIAGDFIMTGGQWSDFSCGSNASTGMAMSVGGNIRISGGTFKMNTKLTSNLNLIPTIPSTTWNQTGGSVTLGNVNVKSGKTLNLIGNKFGDFGAGTGLTVETGSKLMCSNYSVTGAGNFTLQTGAWLGSGSANGLSASGLSGNIQVSGTRSYNSGATYEFYEGISPQSTGNFATTTTSGIYPASVGTLVINKTNPTQIVNLSSTTDVTSNLVLTSGILTTSLIEGAAPWLRIASTGSVTPSGGSANSYVDGFIRRQGQTDFIFPTGNLGRLSSIGITAPSVSTEFEARYVASPYSNTISMASAPITVLDHVSKKEHWFLNKTDAATTPNTKVALYWQDASWSSILKFDSLAVGRWSGSAWENTNCYGVCPNNWTASTPERTYSGTANGIGAAGYIQSNTTSQFGTFTLSSVGLQPFNPLPVQLLAFAAECSEKGDVKVDWVTATERNNDYFTLERSYNGTVFDIVGRIKGVGTSGQLNSYSFEDYEAKGGVNYYRLSQTDFDGTTEQLKVISVRCGSMGGAMVNAYNNNQGQLVVEVSGSENSKYQVRVFDSLGKQVLEHKFNSSIGNAVENLDIAQLERGIYYVQVHNQLKGSTHKISIH